MVCKAILGVLPESAKVEAGAIRFEGRDLLGMPADERRHLLGRSIAMILQNPMTALSPAFRIGDQVTDRFTPVASSNPDRSGRSSPRSIIPTPRRC